MLVVYSIFTRHVNFVFFQKSIIILKKSIFFDYRIWASVSGYAAIYYVMCRVPGGETMYASTHRRPVSHDASSVCPPPLNRAGGWRVWCPWATAAVSPWTESGRGGHCLRHHSGWWQVLAGPCILKCHISRIECKTNENENEHFIR